MPKEQRFNFVSIALKALLFLFFSVVLSFSQAAELGKLTVFSSVGQSLSAEVELVAVSPDEESLLSVQLAPDEAYKKSGLDHSYLPALHISVHQNGGRHYVRISSTEPINEPYIGILLELTVNQERKGREYRIHLDTTEWTNLRSAPLSSAVSAQGLSPYQGTGRQTHTGKISRTKTKASPVVNEEQVQADGYVVRRGDSLSKIAIGLDRTDVSLEQMLVALYRNNPDAFLNENMNLLKEGAVLDLTDVGATSDLSEREARRIVHLHAANFRKYRQQLANMIAQSSAEKAEPSGQIAEGKISGSVKEHPSTISQSSDRLELSRAMAGTDGKTDEEKIALNKALEDANLRIRELEKNVDDLKKLLAVISKNASAIINRSTPAINRPTPAPEESPGTETETPSTTSDSVEPVPLKEMPAASDTRKEAPKPVERKEKVSAAEKEINEDWQFILNNLKNNRSWQIAIGIIIAVILLLVIISAIRRRKASKPKAKPVSATPRPPKKPKEEIPLNPHVISGRDFLANLPPKLDEEDDDAAYRASSRDMSESVDPVEEPVVMTTETVEREASDVPVSETESQQLEELQEAAPVEEIEELPGQVSDETDSITEPESFSEEEADKIIAETAEASVLPEIAADDALGKPVSDESTEPEVIPEQLEPMETTENMVSAENEDTPEGEQIAVAQEDYFTENMQDTLEKENDEEDNPAVNADEPPPLELDLADINLDLESPHEDTDVENISHSDEDVPESNNVEIAAKLELALAYMDMKDNDGARELLEEVIERGNERQSREAREALAHIS